MIGKNLYFIRHDRIMISNLQFILLVCVITIAYLPEHNGFDPGFVYPHDRVHSRLEVPVKPGVEELLLGQQLLHPLPLLGRLKARGTILRDYRELALLGEPAEVLLPGVHQGPDDPEVALRVV